MARLWLDCNMCLWLDYNMPRIDWNNPFANSCYKNRLFVDLCFELGLSQVNTYSTRNDSILDLVLTNDPLFFQVLFSTYH